MPSWTVDERGVGKLSAEPAKPWLRPVGNRTQALAAGPPAPGLPAP